MKIPQNSMLDIDNLKVGDILYTPSVSKTGEKYSCEFSSFKIKEFYKDKDDKYDKYSAILQPEQLITAEGKIQFDTDTSSEIKGSIKNGYCTEETKKACLERFRQEFEGMLKAIDTTLATL